MFLLVYGTKVSGIRKVTGVPGLGYLVLRAQGVE